MAGWFATGASIVLVTHGSNGATGYTRSGEKLSVPGKQIDVVDAVGAGDTFHAAILSYLSKTGKLSKKEIAGLSMPDLGRAIDLALTASAITCSRHGAELPTRTEVEARIRS